MLEKRDTNRRRQNSDYNILVLKVGVNQFGLIVDELFDTEEIVVKPLSGYLKQCKCFSGATIMGDGRVAMILDPGGILAYSGVSLEEIDAEKRRLEEAQNNKAANTTKRTLLLFHNALDEIFAVPLSSILRLEKFNMDRIERIGHKEFLTYYGKGLPLIRLEHYLSVNPMPHTQEDAYLIIPKDGNGAAGIIASRIIDTVETDVVLDSSLATDRGIEGSAIVNDHLTLFIEPNGLLERAGISTHGGTHGH
jgi:two-component system chemotaxis sensor kinase CheA